MSVTFFGRFLRALWKKKGHDYFMQDGATGHTANCSVDVLNGVFEDGLVSRRLRLARSPDLNPYDFYLWVN
jgi:hypothetical protein